MTARTFRFRPLDTWFFRDGRPFDIGPVHTSVVSLFPPPPRTLVGALRFALAQGRGYSGRGSWSAELAAVLGDGPDDMGALRFGGAFLALDDQPLYPMPLHVRGARSEDQKGYAVFEPQTLLAPGREVWSDLGQSRLPVPVATDRERSSGAGFFLRRAGLEAVLSGAVPKAADVVSPDALFAAESRIGLQRDDRKHTAKDGELYTATHVRLRDGVSLLVDVAGVPSDWIETCPRIVGLGGESRMAELEVIPTPPPILAPLEQCERVGRLTVTLSTPLHLRGESMPRPGQGLPGLPWTRVVSACLGKPVLWGGWNSLVRGPLPLRPYLPAGSTWFCTIESPGAEPERKGERPLNADLAGVHGNHLGAEAALGLGSVLVGVWNEPPSE